MRPGPCWLPEHPPISPALCTRGPGGTADPALTQPRAHSCWPRPGGRKSAVTVYGTRLCGARGAGALAPSRPCPPSAVGAEPQLLPDPALGPSTQGLSSGASESRFSRVIASRWEVNVDMSGSAGPAPSGNLPLGSAAPGRGAGREGPEACEPLASVARRWVPWGPRQ